MADKFDPYREALVVETATVWPAELAAGSIRRREHIESVCTRRRQGRGLAVRPLTRLLPPDHRHREDLRRLQA